MKRFILHDNKIKDLKTNKIIGSYTDEQMHDSYEMVKRANRGEQEFLDDAAWIKEQKEIFDKGGHIGGLSDY
jgi:hypothetical protein